MAQRVRNSDGELSLNLWEIFDFKLGEKRDLNRERKPSEDFNVRRFKKKLHSEKQSVSYIEFCPKSENIFKNNCW